MGEEEEQEIICALVFLVFLVFLDSRRNTLYT